jgi:hypothetical protein
MNALGHVGSPLEEAFQIGVGRILRLKKVRSHSGKITQLRGNLGPKAICNASDGLGRGFLQPHLCQMANFSAYCGRAIVLESCSMAQQSLLSRIFI